MSLLQPAFLFASAAIAVPIILHLVFRRHTRIVRLGSIRFLDELMRETVRRRKVRQWLLLALRVACLVLLALLFARPFVRAAQESSGERLVVVLVDQSASMSRRQQGERLVDAATDRANRLLATLGENTTAQAAYFDAAVSPVTFESAGLRRLSAPERLFGSTSYAAALAWARDWCWKAPTAERVVYLYTDLQRSGLDWIAAEPMPDGVTVRIEDLGQTEANNLAIVSATPTPTIVRPGSDATVRATLFNYGEFEFTDVGVQLTLSSDGRQLHFEDTLTVPSQQAVDIEFEVNRLKAGRWEGTLDIDAQDDLAFDNRRHLVMLSRPQSRVVIVDGSVDDPAPGSGIYFLTRAVGLAPPGEQWEESPFRAEVVRYQEGEPLPPLGDAEIVILADCPLVAADAARLRQFVEAGGGLIVFTGEETTATACQPLAGAGLTPGTLGGTRRTSDLPFRIQSWDDEQTVLAPFSDPQQGDLRQFTFAAYTHIDPFPESTVLAKFGDADSPALIERRVGNGRVFWMTSTAGREWNNACRSRLYVPLVHQLLGECVGLTGAGPVQSWTIDAWLDRTAAETPGEMLRPGIIAEDRRSYVISVDARESDPESCVAEELAETASGRDPLDPGSEAVELAELGPRGALASRADEWWPYFVLALIALLFVETLVANRTTA